MIEEDPIGIGAALAGSEPELQATLAGDEDAGNTVTSGAFASR